MILRGRKSGRGSRRPKRQLTLPPPLPKTSPTVRTKKEEEEIRAQRIKKYKEAEKKIRENRLRRQKEKVKRQLTPPPPLLKTPSLLNVRTKKQEKELKEKFNEQRAQQIKMYEEAKKRPTRPHISTGRIVDFFPKKRPTIKSKQKVKDIGARTYKVPARVGTGRRKYNQAAYLSGLGINPAIKRNKNIYKPYANGGGVRKPKYKG